MIPNNPMLGWTRLDADSVKSIPGTVGVYEIADTDYVIVDIGYGGGLSTFGLRGRIMEWLEKEGAWWFRYEVTTAYLSRFNELAMVYQARHGALPREFQDQGILIQGRLQP